MRHHIDGARMCMSTCMVCMRMRILCMCVQQRCPPRGPPYSVLRAHRGAHVHTHTHRTTLRLFALIVFILLALRSYCSHCVHIARVHIARITFIFVTFTVFAPFAYPHQGADVHSHNHVHDMHTHAPTRAAPVRTDASAYPRACQGRACTSANAHQRKHTDIWVTIDICMRICTP